MTTPTLQYFTAVQAFESVDTNPLTTGGNLPQIQLLSGTVTFTPNIGEIQAAPLDVTLMLDPVVGRMNVTANSSTYTSIAGDTFVTIAAKVGGVGRTPAAIAAANPGVTEPITAGTEINIPSADDGVLRSLNGTLGVALVDNVNLGLDADALTYRVDYSNLVWDSSVVQISKHIKPFRFAAPGDGGTVDLTTVARLPL
jgi:hypothetical protein